MNSENKSCCGCTAKVAWAIAVVGAILIVVFLDRQLKAYTEGPPVDAGRAEERAKNLAEIRSAEAEAWDHAGWVDQSKGIVRFELDDAMQLMEPNWENPAA